MVNRILICFGGTDPANETGKALGAVRRLSSAALAVDVVIGRGNPNADLVAQQCRKIKGATLHHGADNMAELMARADLAIGAGGVMSWERCCLGLGALCVTLADNQVEIARALADAGACVYLGADDAEFPQRLAAALTSLLRDAARVRALSERAFELVDGRGAERVCDAIGGRA